MESSDSSDKSKGLGSMIYAICYLICYMHGCDVMGLNSHINEKFVELTVFHLIFCLEAPAKHPINIRAVPTPATGGVSAYHGDMLADARSAVQANFMSGACGTGNEKGCGNDQWMEWRCC